MHHYAKINSPWRTQRNRNTERIFCQLGSSQRATKYRNQLTWEPASDLLFSWHKTWPFTSTRAPTTEISHLHPKPRGCLSLPLH